MVYTVLIGFILMYGTYKKDLHTKVLLKEGRKELKLRLPLFLFSLGCLSPFPCFVLQGHLDYFMNFIRPWLEAIGVPAEIAPLAIIRPISGKAALGMTSDLIAAHGPDSYIGRLAAVLQGSTDTTFYVLTVYFGAVGINKMGDALKVGLLADVVGIILAIVVVSLIW